MSQIKLIGGLGNQMFMYATIRAVQLRNGIDKVYITKDLLKNKGHEVYGLDGFELSESVNIVEKRFNIKSFISFFLFHYYTMFLFNDKNADKKHNRLQRLFEWTGCYGNCFGYYPINPKYKDVVLLGYFQSPKYFDDYKYIIQNEFTVKGPVKDKKMMKKIQNTESVCVHIRRGDYVGTDLDICNLDYYKKAINVIKEKIKNPTFFVFSNDIDWVKENLVIDNCFYVEGNDRFEDLRLMYSCKNFVICNSTYSWWAQYLSRNDNKIVVAPSIWSRMINNPDIYEKGWITIDCK